jgi:hypothetical protein
MTVMKILMKWIVKFGRDQRELEKYLLIEMSYRGVRNERI